MPEASIVVKSTDRYSETVKKMATVTKSFSKDVDKLEDTLYALNKNKYSLKLDASKAKAELKAAEKQFDLTHSAADGLKKELAQANYDNIVRNMKKVSAAARDTEKAISKVENQAASKGGSKSAISSIVNAVAASGAAQMLGDTALNVGNAWAGSMFGSAGGNIAANLLSSTASGAALGTAVGGPGLGTAIGAGIGAITGVVNGITQNYQNKDDSFKSYVQESVESVLGEQQNSLTSGSAIAGTREQTQMAFAQKLGGDAEATAYLGRVKAMAKDTNYTYDEITGYSKLLLNTYDTEKTLSVLKTLSDASAGLNLNSSDVNMFISGLSRMRTTGKTTQEYLNYFSERGVDVYQALANSTGADKSSIAEMVTDGKISGEDAAEAILTYINDTYGGLSEKLATTYDAMVDNLADFQADMDAAMGEGYNEGRKAGIQAQMDWMSGESGEAVEEANRAIGAWKAELENQKEQYVRDAMDAMMASDEYQTAKAEGDAAEMGKLIMQAKVQGMNEYNASEGAQLALESEKALVTSIRNDTVLNQNYWDAGYEKGQEFSKGMAAARRDNYWSGYGSTTGPNPQRNAYRYAVGIDYVPYDNFPALLHQGERVQTAVEARSERPGMSGIQISMYGTTIREDADIDRVAEALLRKVELAATRG
ncbi:tape measure protein [Dysosmobacter sp.]|uniref:tape measure protein n=1 Tax=Dysosmobacter sp. TaxID=2591382 RepID=UPI003AAE1C0C